MKYTTNSMCAGSLQIREEIVRVIGTERPPTFDDRASLPCMECIFSEILRWGAPVPLSLDLPQVPTENDEYNGFEVLARTWSILRLKATMINHYGSKQEACYSPSPDRRNKNIMTMGRSQRYETIPSFPEVKILSDIIAMGDTCIR